MAKTSNPSGRGLSRRTVLRSAASITAGGRGRDPLSRPESGGLSLTSPENVIPLTWRPVARTIYSDRTVAVHADDFG